MSLPSEMEPQQINYADYRGIKFQLSILLEKADRWHIGRGPTDRTGDIRYGQCHQWRSLTRRTNPLNTLVQVRLQRDPEESETLDITLRDKIGELRRAEKPVTVLWAERYSFVINRSNEDTSRIETAVWGQDLFTGGGFPAVDQPITPAVCAHLCEQIENLGENSALLSYGG
jgi:hypothetical protein